MSKDELCKRVADEFVGAAEKVFDEIPNMRQLNEFFNDGMSIATASIEAATWPKEDRGAALLRTGSYMSLGMARAFAKLSDEKPAEVMPEPEPADEPEPDSAPEVPENAPPEPGA